MKRKGVACVELAVMLPLLMFFFVISIDYGRLFYYSQIVTNCARNGAIWSGDSIAQSMSPYKTLQDAVTADAYGCDISKMTISQKSGSDSAGNWVEVTVTYPFTTITKFLGPSSNAILSSFVHVKVSPITPKGS